MLAVASFGSGTQAWQQISLQVPISARFSRGGISRVLDTLQTVTSLEIGFFGLAPGKVGMYQVNFRMPDPLPAGRAWLDIQEVLHCGSLIWYCTGINAVSTEWYSFYGDKTFVSGRSGSLLGPQ